MKFNDNSPRARYYLRGGPSSGHSLQMRELWGLVADALTLACAAGARIDSRYDRNVLTDSICERVEKRLGIYPNTKERESLGERPWVGAMYGMMVKPFTLPTTCGLCGVPGQYACSSEKCPNMKDFKARIAAWAARKPGDVNYSDPV